MANTIAENESIIDQQIAASPDIEVLSENTSNVSIIKTLRSSVALFHSLMQRNQDDYLVTVENAINNNHFGTDPWWIEQMKAYQYGDLLSFINNIFQYAVIDATKNVIQLVAVVSDNGIVTLKCASLINGVPQQLSDAQLAGAQAYAKETRPCGITPVVQSYAADLIKIVGNITYDPQGDLPTIKIAVYAAINSYLNNLSTTEFNGTFYINKLIDAIQTIPGVIEDQVLFTEVAAKSALLAYTDIISHYPAVAGYFVIDSAYPLAATLNFVAA